MNPNSFKSSNEFNVDDEIAKLWRELEESFRNLDKEKANSGSERISNYSDDSTNIEPKKLFNPPDLPADNFVSNPGPEAPHFLRSSNTQHEDEQLTPKKIFNPPELPADNFVSNPGPEVPSFANPPHFYQNGTQKYSNEGRPNSEGFLKDAKKIPSSRIEKANLNNIKDLKKTRNREALESKDVARSREKWQKTGNKVIKTAKIARRIYKNIKSVISEDVDSLRRRTNDFYELNKTKLAEKYHIFKEEKHENKKVMLDLGKKATAILLVTLTIGGTASAVSRTKRPDELENSTTTAADESDTKTRDSVENIYNQMIFDENNTENAVSIEQNTTELDKNEETLVEQTTATETTTSPPHSGVDVDKNNTSQDESSDLVYQTQAMFDELENNNESTTAIEAENNENKSEIKDDMKLGIHLTEYMKNEMNFIKKTYKENIETYKRIVEKIKEDTGIDIPTEAICAIHYRESRCDFDSYLQNGDPLGQVTTHVPKGLYFENFFDSAVAAIESQLKGYQDYNKVDFYSMKGLCKFTNRYNGFGSQRYYGLPSSYVYAGTSKYQGGMYVADGSFRENKEDPRMGTYPIISELANLS